MHRHRRRAVLERVVLHERDFGERGERFHALRFVLNRALDQRHWDALGRALGEIRHERFRRWALRHGLGDGEVEGRGDAPGIARATRCCIDEARSLRLRSRRSASACACSRPPHGRERAAGDPEPPQASLRQQHRCVPCGSEAGLRLPQAAARQARPHRPIRSSPRTAT